MKVPGKFELKGHDRIKGLSSLNVDRQDQFLPQQRRNVTYVSRLQVSVIVVVVVVVVVVVAAFVFLPAILVWAHCHLQCFLV